MTFINKQSQHPLERIDFFLACVSAIKAKVGAATARGMAMRALFCDKLGLRRMKPAVYNVFPGLVDQDLHVQAWRSWGNGGACSHDQLCIVGVPACFVRLLTRFNKPHSIKNHHRHGTELPVLEVR